ncbi:hypothetical protein KY330_05790 [Candidatus Woesearchaeota archaeon]|nr:hypothetical protein [Candidatus Woesearchaeota archaeon]
MNLALNPFDRGKRPEVVEKIESVDKVVGETFARYLRPGADYKDILMTPANIKGLMDLIAVYYSDLRTIEKTDTVLYVGNFIDAIIKNAYEAGYSKFELDVGHKIIDVHGEEGDFPWWRLCSGLRPKKRIKIKVLGSNGHFKPDYLHNVELEYYGEAADNFGARSQNSIFKLNSNAGLRLGDKSRSCEFYVKGDVKDYCGLETRDCSYYVKGNAGQGLGLYSVGSWYCIKKDVGKDLGLSASECFFSFSDYKSLGDGAGRCTFATRKKNVLEKLKKEVKGYNSVGWLG